MMIISCSLVLAPCKMRIAAFLHRHFLMMSAMKIRQQSGMALLYLVQNHVNYYLALQEMTSLLRRLNSVIVACVLLAACL